MKPKQFKQFKFGEWIITVDNLLGNDRLILTRMSDNSELIFKKDGQIE